MYGRTTKPMLGDERGFTLVEIMVAISILLIGVLGVTAMTSYSNRTSVTNNSRQGATTVLRRALETSRALPFRSIKSATIVADIQTQSPDLASTSGAGTWTVNRDGYVYTLTANVCRVDDDSDGYGVHDGADPTFCADSSTTGTADDKAGDYKRVTVTASWTANGATKSIKQVTLVPPGGTGDAPAVTDVHPTSPSAPAGQPLVLTSTPAGAQISFSATTTNSPNYMSWLIDGTPNLTCPPTITNCGGSGNSWTFNWALGTPTIDNTAGSINQGKCIAPTSSAFVFDGTYQVGALPLDNNGLAGSGASTPVTINRCAPVPPPNFNVTGQEANYAGPVDIEWNDNAEGDIVGYKVFRGTSTTNFVAMCPPNTTDPPIDDMYNCIDPTPPAHKKGVPVFYAAVAYDQDSTGALRQGAVAYLDSESPVNREPNQPTNLTATPDGSGGVTVSWKVPGTLDPDAGDTIESFRVYRRAALASGAWTYQNRLSLQYPPDEGYDSITAFCNGLATGGASCSYTDSQTGGVTHQYTVTSVDSHLRESNYLAGAGPTA